MTDPTIDSAIEVRIEGPAGTTTFVDRTRIVPVRDQSAVVASVVPPK